MFTDTLNVSGVEFMWFLSEIWQFLLLLGSVILSRVVTHNILQLH